MTTGSLTLLTRPTTPVNCMPPILPQFESGAMLLYLADKYGPANTPEQRARAAQWVLFANSTMGNSIFVEQFR